MCRLACCTVQVVRCAQGRLHHEKPWVDAQAAMRQEEADVVQKYRVIVSRVQGRSEVKRRNKNKTSGELCHPQYS